MAFFDHKYIASLVKLAQCGDSNAFAELYGLTYEKQYTYAYQYLRDPYLAQDALQEVYILALKNLSKLQEPKVFVAWLKQINFRVCYDMSNKSAKQWEVLDETAFSVLPDENIENNPREKVIKDYESFTIREALASLPEHERDAITYKYLHNMKLEEIGKQMNCSLSTIKRYLSSGKIHLEKMLKERE
ncbi:RNA polymerase sigma factor [Anaerolentibacter hominis]|uniref:RNA polymerase sigma factor n=1 Tax=Anaerolentibacter hominis TaxID=3079009 RepID=UPI0031B81862